MKEWTYVKRPFGFLKYDRNGDGILYDLSKTTPARKVKVNQLRKTLLLGEAVEVTAEELSNFVRNSREI